MNLRQLILRSNRFLGSALVEKGLLKEAELDLANERLLEQFQSADVSRPRLLHILVNEMQVLREADLFSSLAQGAPVGLLDLTRIKVTVPEEYRAEECEATASLPFDQVEDHTFIATSYYLSSPIRDYWKDRVPGPIEWFVTSINSMDQAMDVFLDTAGSNPGQAPLPKAVGAG